MKKFRTNIVFANMDNRNEIRWAKDEFLKIYEFWTTVDRMFINHAKARFCRENIAPERRYEFIEHHVNEQIKCHGINEMSELLDFRFTFEHGLEGYNKHNSKKRVYTIHEYS